MLKKILFAAALAAAAWAGPAAAQDPAFAKALADIEKAVPAPAPAEMAKPALETLQAIARSEKACVPTGVAMDPAASASATLLVAQLIGAKQIRNGWTAYGRPQGCPPKAPTRFLVFRMASGELLLRVVNVGESLTPPSMMRDSSAAVAFAALAAIRKADPACAGPEGMRMEETRIVSRSPDLGADFHGQRYSGSWREAWTFSVCGHRAEVPVTFVNDGQGGASWTVDERQAKVLS